MNDFTKVMSERSDEQLIEIVTRQRNDYQPQALEAAEKELERRNLSTEILRGADQRIAQKNEAVAEKANKPLGPVPKALAFLFPGFIFFLAMLLFKADGYDRRSRELGRWTLYGVGFYLALIALIKIL